MKSRAGMPADIEDRMRASGLTVERVDTLDSFAAIAFDRRALRGDEGYRSLTGHAEAR